MIVGWKQGRGEAPEQCPEGPRVLAYMAGSGRVVRGEYQGKVSPRFRLTFQVEQGAEKGLHKTDGTPYEIGAWLGGTIQPGSNAGKLIVTARGRDLAESEMGAVDDIPAAGAEEPLPAPVETLLAGLRVLATVKHNDKGWAGFHIESCVKAPALAASEGW